MEPHHWFHFEDQAEAKPQPAGARARPQQLQSSKRGPATPVAWADGDRHWFIAISADPIRDVVDLAGGNPSVQAEGIRDGLFGLFPEEQDLSLPEGSRGCGKLQEVQCAPSLSILWFAVIRAASLLFLQTTFFVVNIWSGEAFSVIIAISYIYWQQQERCKTTWQARTISPAQ